MGGGKDGGLLRSLLIPRFSGLGFHGTRKMKIYPCIHLYTMFDSGPS